MKYKLSTGMIVFRIINYLLMAVITIACIVPLWHVLMGSMSNPTAVTTTKGLILTPLKNFDFQSYTIIMKYEKLWGGYLNTLIYLAMQCVLTGVLTVVAGYVFSRKRFRTRNFFMMIISFTMLFNGGMIPTYMVIRKIGLLEILVDQISGYGRQQKGQHDQTGFRYPEELFFHLRSSVIHARGWALA